MQPGRAFRLAERTAGLHPVIDKVGNEALAQLDFCRFAKPSLCDVQHQQHTCDHAENAQLMKKPGEIAL